MKFLDEAKIYLQSGAGGNGCVSFRREKFAPDGGPDGGNGGAGGSIVFRANNHLNTLMKFRYKQNFIAQNGESGKGSNRTGKSRDNLVLEVPVGTQIYTEDKLCLIYDFTSDGEEFEILSGGKGGAGNACFRSSTNQAPRTAIPGEPGKELWVCLQLKLISDIGLVGLPNAGKSTFLASTSAAKPKIADYPFTTLSPNLGVLYVDDEEFVVADIPGLIEGAHEGHGLGDKFLKHIERCASILHLIDISNDEIKENYLMIRRELELYSESLANKHEIVALTKIDSIPDEFIEEKIAELSEVCNSEIFAISSLSKKGMTPLLRALLKQVRIQRGEEE